MAGMKSWSTTAANNVLANTGFTMDEGQAPSTLNDSIRQAMADIRTEWAQGANIASAATVDLSAATGGYVHITGAVTITAFGTVSAGIRRKITFDGALTLTHNATSLILPTGASIVTVAGDTCEAMSEGSGNWRVLWYAGKSVQATTIVAGGIKVSAGTGTTAGSINLGGGTQFQIVGGTGGFAVIDSTNSFNNIAVTDAGNATIRGTLDIPGGLNPGFTSAETAVGSAAGNTTIAHGLGAVPRLIYVAVRNKSAELGYSFGDEVLLPVNPTTITLYADATNIGIVVTSSSWSVVRKDTFVSANITPASWKYVVRAYK